MNGKFAGCFKVIVYLFIILFNYAFQSIYCIYRQYCFLQKNHTANLCSSLAWILIVYYFPTTCWVLYVLTTTISAAQLKIIKLLKSSLRRNTMKTSRIWMCSLLDCLWACWLAFPSFPIPLQEFICFFSPAWQVK